jgi:hypothetical protein
MASEGALDGRYVCEIGMSMAVERLLRSGYQVALPIIDDGYDILALDGRRCWRLQVKATARTAGKNKTRVRISRGGRKQLRYDASQVDAFVIANISTGMLLCVPFGKASGKSWINFSIGTQYADFQILRGIKPHKN